MVLEDREFRPLVAFDMDGVLVEERSSWRRIHHHLGTDNEDSFLAYMRGEIDDLEFMARDIKMWLQSRPELNRTLMEEILYGSKRMMEFPDSLLSISGNGIETVILSGGIDILADQLAREGRIGSVLANGIEFDINGHLTGKGILRVPLRDKGSVLRKFIKERGPFYPVISVGDSHVDITMFEISDISIAFRPESKEVSDSSTITIDRGGLGEVERVIIEQLAKVHHKLL
jgi:HAD superfamily PSPase-like hydrolase